MAAETWLISAIIAAAGFVSGRIACAGIKKTGIVDAPDGDRKQQAEAVPRLGGVGILLGALGGVVIGGVVLSLFQSSSLGTFIAQCTNTFVALGLQIAHHGPLTVFVAGAFLLGLWDDIWTANTKLKLLILAALCVGSATFGLVPEALSSPFGAVSAPAILIIGAALWFLVFTNAVNFIDGANGIAFGSLTIMLAGLAATGLAAGDWAFSYWWFALFGAILAFLVQNLRGHIYAGDAGALGLGALFSGLAVSSGLEVWTAATLALPFLLDVLLTLIWRAKQRRSWLKPHLDHAYQRLIAKGWSHLDVAILYWAMSVACAVAAYVAAQGGGDAPFAVFWVLCLAGIVLWVRHRRSA